MTLGVKRAGHAKAHLPILLTARYNLLQEKHTHKLQLKSMLVYYTCRSARTAAGPAAIAKTEAQ